MVIQQPVRGAYCARWSVLIQMSWRSYKPSVLTGRSLIPVDASVVGSVQRASGQRAGVVAQSSRERRRNGGRRRGAGFGCQHENREDPR